MILDDGSAVDDDDNDDNGCGNDKSKWQNHKRLFFKRSSFLDNK